MIYCVIKGKDCAVHYTHPNGRGIITTFLYFVDQNEVMERVKKWAKENNYDCLRFHVVD